ncbi:MAG: Rrf2 family transcriptional regulator [Armatimonadetes bacterium]|nr:Rrf2 family transcriptional regulator [Armatimonadota bacterium]
MKIINKNVDYALRSLIHIAKENGQVVSVSNLAEREKISKAFLRKILQILNKEKIVNSIKGKSGGFVLAKIPNEIFLMDLINIFQGKIKLLDCFVKKNICPQKKECILSKKMEKIEKMLIFEIKNISLASLLNGDGKDKPI